MIFIDPKIDFAFKKIFGNEQHKNILISFLNAMIYDCRPVIEDVEILNPYLAPKIRGVKKTFLDVKAIITGGITVIIEMQVLHLEGFEKRILYNAAKTYSTQLKSGDNYTELNPVIALTICNFTMFPNLSNIVSRFVLKEKDFLLDYPNYDLELIFVELPKFVKTLPELNTLFDQWLYFITKAPSLNEIPETLGNIPDVYDAFQVANQINFTPEEMEELEQQQLFINDNINAVVKGFKDGRQQEKIEIARQLLKFLDVETISQTTGLTVDEIHTLQNS
ncbi:MAG TPA: Rpn family recombination-promoting nuclease/putative transposase [Allocoleopsis sp.]